MARVYNYNLQAERATFKNHPIKVAIYGAMWLFENTLIVAYDAVADWCTSTRLRPSVFAWYRASSASRISPSVAV